MSKNPIYTDAEWTIEQIEAITDACAEIADGELGLTYYPLQIEIVTSEQMIDATSSVGMPINYSHWSFGKARLGIERAYQRGRRALAYELVINSNPCILYCMEENTMTMQATVIAHAGFGHNHYFKNNFLFQQWTHPDAILDYLTFAKKFIAQCEERYGIDEVEHVLDACHALQYYGVDRYKHPPELSVEEEEKRQQERIDFHEKQRNVLWRTLPSSSENNKEEKEEVFPQEPQENILYFIEKYAPELSEWKRELIRIVRKQSQYLYPQMHTKGPNEGFACFVHYYIMNRLWEKGLLTEGAYLEFIRDHNNIILQPDFDDRRFNGINPYALWFKLFMDIKRMCIEPTEEDKHWFPDIAGGNWRETILIAASDFKAEGAIRQFLSPQLIRDFKLFSILDDDRESVLKVTSIHREDGYARLRSVLADQHDVGLLMPNIEVVHVDTHGDRTLKLEHRTINRIPLYEPDARKVLDHVRYLWEFPVVLKTQSPKEEDILFVSEKKKKK